MRACETKRAVYSPFQQPGEEVRRGEDIKNKERKIPTVAIDSSLVRCFYSRHRQLTCLRSIFEFLAYTAVLLLHVAAAAASREMSR